MNDAGRYASAHTRAVLAINCNRNPGDLKFWQKALREAEREPDAATTRTALDAAAKKFMRAKAELKRLQAEISA